MTSDIPETEKRQALERVLASTTFHRSDQLKSLLRYVCEREILGFGESLDEYTVAVEALGRPKNYTALEDGTARNRIHGLRRRLEQYYETENPTDEFRISVPKGSYRPTFQRRPVEIPTPAILEPGVPRVTSPPAELRPLRLWERKVSAGAAASVGLGAIALITIALAVVFQKGGPPIDPVVAEAWGPLLSRNANPLICLATAAQLTLIQRKPDAQASPTVSSQDLLSWYNTLPGLPPAKEIYLGPSLTSPFWGDVAGALSASQLLHAAGSTAEFLPESAVQLPALTKRNVLMFGRPEFSNTVDHFLRNMPIRIRIPDESHPTVIWSTDPKSGKAIEYDGGATSKLENKDTAYGLITVVPSGGNEELRTVIFSGTRSPGTQAASEYFSSPKHLEALRAEFRKEGYFTFPLSYQVVVRAHVFDTSALDVAYVTHRVVRVK